jgi:pyruvate/2-oxoglutarate dehydrogenase complex dihydrolipoamide dehydrogenase (E3) component
MTNFDAIIIGAGQAGPPLAHRLAKSGMKVAAIERKLFGGTCVNTGCIPTKTLVASAYAAHLARRASSYGVTLTGEVKVDMRALKARKDGVLMKSRTAVEAGLRKLPNCTVYQGHARFESPTQVRVGNELLSADKIFLNVGGRAGVPELPGVEKISYLTNSTILDLEVVPSHLVVVGGSYVGLEFAQMFRRFGSEVTIVEKGSRLAQHEDEDVSAAIKEILEAEGIQIRLGAECIHFDASGSESIVGTSCKVGAPEIAGSHVLLAMGRQPNTDDLGLDEIGMKRDERGYVVVDDELLTSVEGIWALGDCNGRGGFTHTSYNDYEIVAGNLLDKEHRRVTDRIQAHALYIDPPLGQIGMTETQVRESGKPTLMATRPMSKVGRAVEKGETQGFMKILVDAESKRILGASILGTGGDEAIHCILDTMYADAPYTILARAVHIHPTVCELIPTTLQSLKPLADAKDK